MIIGEQKQFKKWNAFSIFSPSLPPKVTVLVGKIYFLNLFHQRLPTSYRVFLGKIPAPPHNLLAGIRSRLLSGIHVHRSKRSCKNKKYLFVYVCFECKQNKKKVIFTSRSGLHRTNLNEMFLEFFFLLALLRVLSEEDFMLANS